MPLPLPLPAAATSTPYWLTNLPTPLQNIRNYQTSPTLPTHVMDVVIIGSGMTGASVAYHLSANQTPTQNQNICVLDGRGLCSGATGRNGGFLHAHSFNQWWPLYEKYGVVTATKLCWMEKAGRQAIHDVSQTEHIECELDTDVKLAMLFPTNQGMRDKLGWFHSLRHTILSFCGIQALDTTKECAQVFNIPPPPSTTNSPDAAQDSPIQSAIVIDQGCDTFWPAKFVLTICQRLIDRNVTVHTHTMVTKVTRTVHNQQALYVVSTDRGQDILTKNVVHATNGWVSGLLPDFEHVIQPVLNTVVSASPSRSLLRDPQRRTGMDLQPGYHYWHSRQDGTIVLGGFRNTRPDRGVGVWQDGAPAEKDVVAAEHLLHELGFFHESGGTDRGARGDSLTIDQAWTGIIGWSMDGLPFVGPWERRGGSQDGVGGMAGAEGAVAAGKEYVCAGFSGHGMTQTWLAGKAVADMIETQQQIHTGTLSIPALCLEWYATKMGVVPGGYSFLLPTPDRIGKAKKKGGDWLAYEKSKEEEM